MTLISDAFKFHRDFNFYRSADNGTSWNVVNTGLPCTHIRAPLVKGEYLFSGGDTSGVWRHALSEMITSVEESSVRVPVEFSLSQNYPNPFKPTTMIRYSTPHRSHVLLTVFNILGQKVAELVNGDVDPGPHVVTFDRTGLASDPYFYRVQAGSLVAARTLLSIR